MICPIGTFDGKVQVLVNLENEEDIGERPLTVDTTETVTVSIPIKPMTGTCPLYFAFTGNGKLNFTKFDFV